MKSSHLFKMLVVAIALQSAPKIMSIPIYSQDGSDCWTKLFEQWETKKDKALALKILKYANEDFANGNELVKNYLKNIDLTQVELVAYPSKRIMAKLGSIARQLKTSRKTQIGTALTLIGIIAAYRNREAIKTNAAKAGKYIVDSKMAKATSSAVSSAADYVGSTRAVTKPTEWIKNGYSWAKSKTPAFPSFGQLKSLTTSTIPSK